MARKTPQIDLKESWRKFNYGDSLTYAELGALKKSAEEGERYLAARGEQMALFKTRIDLSRIEQMLDAREVFK